MRLRACIALHSAPCKSVTPMLLLVLDKLAIKFVGERVNRRVHVFVLRRGEQIGPGDMHIGLGLVHHFLNSEDNLCCRNLVEVSLQAFKLAFHVFLQGRCDVEMVTTDVELHFRLPITVVSRRRPGNGPTPDGEDRGPVHTRRLRSLDGGMNRVSRYLAMVRLATWIPCSSSSWVILLSLSGLRGFSAATSFRISARMAVEEHSPPAVVATWLEKKYLSSKIPRGVCMYLFVVTREMVDSCISTSSAMSCSTRGFMASSPYSRKLR